MGDSRVAGAFKLGLYHSHLFRRLLGEGALTAAVHPHFSREKEKTHGEIEMWRTANAVISGLVIAAAPSSAWPCLPPSRLNVHTFDTNTE